VLARQPGVPEVVAVDPSPVFIAKAHEAAAAEDAVSFETGRPGAPLP
jgi:hypothetical protein